MMKLMSRFYYIQLLLAFGSLLLVSQSGCCCCWGLVVPLSAANPVDSLKGVSLCRLGDNESIDLGKALVADTTTGNDDDNQKTMLVLGTHTADFNMIEYGQRIRSFWPQLQAKGITRCMMVMNGKPESCQKLAELIDLPAEVEIFPDPTGVAGRKFGVCRGFRPEDDNIPIALKVTVVGLGFGPPWGTLPAVLTGYFGNPWGQREWIEESLKQGQLAGRWPKVLELEKSEQEDGEYKIVGNKFDNFPVLSGWGRRPFELATLRLQNLVDIQIKYWDELKPVDDRSLTQLGGCTIVDTASDGNVKPIYSWVDRGLCDVPDMNEVLKLL